MRSPARLLALAGTVGSLLVGVGCATGKSGTSPGGGTPQAPRLTEAQVKAAQSRWPQSGPEDLENGRVLYKVRCSTCHALEAPSERTLEDWERVLLEMQPHAHLTDAQRESVFRYLWAAKAPAATAIQ